MLAARVTPAAVKQLLVVMAYDTRVRVSGSVVQPVSVEGTPGCTLDDYMRLPVAAYASLPMPFDSSLDRQPNTDSDFLLRVPPVSFGLGVNLTVSPSLVACVTAESDRVVITSDECTLSGSPLVEALQLNECFDFRVRTAFTWTMDPQAIHSETCIEVDVDPPGPFALVPRRLLEATGNAVMSFAMGRLQAAFIRSLADDYSRWAVDDAYRDERMNSR